MGIYRTSYAIGASVRTALEGRFAGGHERDPVYRFDRLSVAHAAGIRGFDAGKKIKGRKRHIIVDTLGLMVGLMFTVPTSKIVTALPIC